jgi:hypothetical protein
MVAWGVTWPIPFPKLPVPLGSTSSATRLALLFRITHHSPNSPTPNPRSPLVSSAIRPRHPNPRLAHNFQLPPAARTAATQFDHCRGRPLYRNWGRRHHLRSLLTPRPDVHFLRTCDDDDDDDASSDSFHSDSRGSRRSQFHEEVGGRVGWLVD